MSTKNITEILLSFYPDIQGIYFFGSYGTNNLQAESDIDIALLLPYQKIKKERYLSQFN
jgi:predicted nucleotidyltransferase